ncbi:PCNA-associated factor-like [Ceratina calcarata]|uniref:PCNA-associated factor n=1 Tax=Ceratina calcarata TaxID=156304 RepID=A0AAJ7JCA2_9HYME|nr:PCNA-associated factor-like [Ceratina calcarata]
MVRTRADRIQAKAVGSKAPSKVAAIVPSSPVVTPSKRRGKSYSGGNPYHPRDTPEWQKPITNFLNPDSVYSEITNTTPATPSPKRAKESANIASKIEELCDDEDSNN